MISSVMRLVQIAAELKKVLASGLVWSSESYFSIRLMVCLGGVGGYLFASQRCSAGGWRSVRALLEEHVRGVQGCTLLLIVYSVVFCGV